MKTKIVVFIALIINFYLNAQVIEITDLQDSSLGENSGYKYDLTEMNGNLYFINEASSLYQIDQTNTLGATQIKVVDIATSGNQSQLLQVMGNKLFFVGKDTNNNGFELWKSDGTENGTEMVKDINPGVNNGVYTSINLATTSNLVFFVADDGNGKRLWKSDGTASGTVIVKHINTAQTNDDIRAMYVANDILYFTAATDTNGLELWKTDGTAAGTVMIKDINTGSASSDPKAFFEFNNQVYFQALSSNEGVELWKTDGTTSGTVLLKDINTGTSGSYPEGFFTYNNNMYFEALTSSQGKELWKTDGTTTGTTLLKDIYPGTGNGPYARAHYFAIANNELFFVARESYSAGRAIWKTDGTPSGTVKVGGSIVTNSSQDSRIISYHDKIYFTGWDATHHNEFWECDGTTTGTQMLLDINPGGSPSTIYNGYTVFNDDLYFVAYKPSSGREIWKLSTSTASLNTFKDLSLEILANPVLETIKIAVQENAAYSLINLKGQVLKTGKLQTGVNSITDIAFPKGVYILKISNQNKSATKRIIIN